MGHNFTALYLLFALVLTLLNIDSFFLFLEYFTHFCVFFFQDQEGKIGDLSDFNFFLLTESEISFFRQLLTGD